MENLDNFFENKDSAFRTTGGECGGLSLKRTKSWSLSRRIK